ncbi:MAG TPA: ATP-grasp domain-containing protein [Candidatus Babeliales bacterium]|jgi:glutathione synthase/RimK-type ligase-like ATP-grasp enzyme|nr:ATP-grasp domain-containing protein [Candidatus Babeliales bacterium]
MQASLAILYDEGRRFLPSNPAAIENFIDSAKRNGLDCEVIQEVDLNELHRFEALFIRNTTSKLNETYHFAAMAHMLDIPCIDDIYSIGFCTDKIKQAHAFEINNILTPLTFCISRNNYEFIGRIIKYPVVIKRPDGCFSRGVYKARDRVEYEKMCYDLFKKPEIYELVVQEFIKTEFDWRICSLHNKPLFAVKYYIPKGDFRIVKYKNDNEFVEGEHECVPMDQVPAHILRAAYQASICAGNGLYGVDIKEKDNAAYVIEVNDNPSIDAGIEDELEQEKIYDSITRWFVNRL